MKSSLFFGLSFFACVTLGYSQEPVAHEQWQDGDIVFIKNPKLPGASGDKGKFNCAGIIFHENKQLVVFYADEPLKKCSLDEFIALSEDKKYTVKWLSDSSMLTDEAIKTMHTFATAKLGTKYDTKEDLNSNEFYNAEFVWKIFRSSLGIHLCEPKELTASNDDKEISSSNLANKYVTVRDILKSELLQ